MRFAALSSLALTLFLTSAASAGTGDRRTACRDQATELADQWAAGHIRLAQDSEEAEVTIIAAGVKYIVPNKVRGKMEPTSQLIWERKRVYREEFYSCLNQSLLGLSDLRLPPENTAN